MAKLISIAGLRKTYPGATRGGSGGSSPRAGTVALADVSLDVAPGTFLVLLGPSGSGKTTLLRCLAGIERIDGGAITIGAAMVADGRAHVPPEQRDLSMVFQDYALWPHLNARDNVAFALRRRRLPRAQARSQALAMLDRVGLAELAHRYPNELSGGQQQRVALARALVGDTGLILCDEPLSNLDADLRERMRVEISSLVREAGATTVYITHDQAEAFALADQVGVLEDGRIVQAGTPEEIYNSPATPFVARFTGLAGEIRVQVTARTDDGGIEVKATGTGQVFTVPSTGQPSTAQSPAAHGGEALAPGSEALLAIRPTGVHLARGTGGTGGTDGEAHLTGRVSDVAFRGRGYELAIDLPGHGRLTGVFALHRVARGDQVGLRLLPEGTHLFPASAP